MQSFKSKRKICYATHIFWYKTTKGEAEAEHLPMMKYINSYGIHDGLFMLNSCVLD